MAELLTTLGLEADIVEPNPAGAWLAMPGPHGGVDAAPLPKTGMLGIPANPLGDDVRRIIGWGGAIRAYADRLMPILTIGRARSLGQLVRSRMGDAVLDRLGVPAGRAAMVGDSPEDDLEGARALGMQAFLVDREDVYPDAEDRLPDLFALPAAIGLAAI